jgi:hypothetical protein
MATLNFLNRYTQLIQSEALGATLAIVRGSFDDTVEQPSQGGGHGLEWTDGNFRASRAAKSIIPDAKSRHRFAVTVLLRKYHKRCVN